MNYAEKPLNTVVKNSASVVSAIPTEAALRLRPHRRNCAQFLHQHLTVRDQVLETAAVPNLWFSFLYFNQITPNINLETQKLDNIRQPQAFSSVRPLRVHSMVRRNWR